MGSEYDLTSSDQVEVLPVSHANILFLSDQHHTDVAEKRFEAAAAGITPLSQCDFCMGKLGPWKDGPKRAPLRLLHCEQYETWTTEHRCGSADFWEKGTEWKARNETFPQCPKQATGRLAAPLARVCQAKASGVSRRNSAPPFAPLADPLPPKPRRRSCSGTSDNFFRGDGDWQRAVLGDADRISRQSSPGDGLTPAGTTTPSEDEAQISPHARKREGSLQINHQGRPQEGQSERSR